MSLLKEFAISSWQEAFSQETQNLALSELEAGKVLYFPSLPFVLEAEEHSFFSPHILDVKAKNISYDIRKERLAGARLEENALHGLREMLFRYAQVSRHFLEHLFPEYKAHLVHGRTSYRPVEISGRKISKRKDDTRLHVDAFPSSPNKGRRILRIFTNINPEGKPRVWRVGEPLEEVLRRFLPELSAPIWGSSALLKWLKITKDYRTLYDHYMLGVHDRMKCDEEYQKSVPQEGVSFPPGSSWIVYTDQVSHAAMSGQYVLEQTFHIPVSGLKKPSTAPLMVMEKLLNKALI